jgi:hypothetical protein
MNLGRVSSSKNFKDNTNLITRNSPDLNYPLINMFWRQMRQNPNDYSTIPHQTNPGQDIEDIPYHNLSEYEKTLVQDYGFNPQDILLLRTFHTDPGQVMEGWKFQK